jgi:PRTRC genetic system protein E
MEKNLFEFIADYCENTDVNVIFSGKKGIITMIISFKPKNENDHIPQIILRGTADELQEGFVDALKEPMIKAKGLVTNLEFFNTQAKRVESEKKAASTPKKKATPKKTAEKKETVESAKEEPKEEVATGQTGIFDDKGTVVEEKPVDVAKPTPKPADTTVPKTTIPGGNRELVTPPVAKKRVAPAVVKEEPKAVVPTPTNNPDTDFDEDDF